MSSQTQWQGSTITSFDDFYGLRIKTILQPGGPAPHAPILLALGLQTRRVCAGGGRGLWLCCKPGTWTVCCSPLSVGICVAVGFHHDATGQELCYLRHPKLHFLQEIQPLMSFPDQLVHVDFSSRWYHLRYECPGTVACIRDRLKALFIPPEASVIGGAVSLRCLLLLLFFPLIVFLSLYF